MAGAVRWVVDCEGAAVRGSHPRAPPAVVRALSAGRAVAQVSSCRVYRGRGSPLRENQTQFQLRVTMLPISPWLAAHMSTTAENGPLGDAWVLGRIRSGVSFQPSSTHRNDRADSGYQGCPVAAIRKADLAKGRAAHDGWPPPRRGAFRWSYVYCWQPLIVGATATVARTGSRVGWRPSAPLTAKTLNARDLSSGPHGPSEAPAQAACTPGPRRAGRNSAG
jgi:hypothetical protein